MHRELTFAPSAQGVSNPKRLLCRVLFALAFFVSLSIFFPHKAEANISCTQSTQSGIDFGNSSTAVGMINWTCSNFDGVAASGTLCLGMGNPSFPGTASQFIMLEATTGDQLEYVLYTDAGRSQRWTTTNPITFPVSLPATIGSMISGSEPFYGEIPAGQSAPAGNYSANVFNMVIGWQDSGGVECVSAIPPNLQGQEFTLNVSATNAANCTVDALGPADLGTVLASATNVSGQTTIAVTCPTNTPYYIGLAPSNGNSDGLGDLAGTGSNTDSPTYQLRSGSASGPIWGNTATDTSVGNGVGDTGTGNPQNHTVYVTMPSVNFSPDTYTDTVTVNVNY